MFGRLVVGLCFIVTTIGAPVLDPPMGIPIQVVMHGLKINQDLNNDSQVLKDAPPPPNGASAIIESASDNFSIQQSKWTFSMLKLLSPEEEPIAIGDSKRSRRDLATNKFLPGSNRRPFFNVDRKRKLEMRSRRVDYNYKMWEEGFKLDGNASLRMEGSNLRLVFDYVIIGEGTVKIDVVRSEYSRFESRLDTRLIEHRKPRNCLLHNTQLLKSEQDCSERLNETASFNQNQTIRRLRHRQLEANNPNYQTFNRISQQNTRREVKNATRNMTNGAQNATKCKDKVFKYKTVWFCVNPKFTPCFVVSSSGGAYKVSQKICPKQLAIEKLKRRFG